MVAAQASREPDGKAGAQTGGVASLQLEDGQELPAERRVSAVLVLPLGVLGRPIFGQMVYENDAIQDRTDEEGGAPIAAPQAVAVELVPSQKAVFQRH